MPVVIILFLIFFILIVHIAYLKWRNRQLEKKANKNFHPDSNQDDMS
jgi:cbb3-type cytochrome oxidase subunit 3